MKLCISQIGDALCVFNGRASTTYPLAEFDELYTAMTIARAGYGAPTEVYTTLFANEEFNQGISRPPPVQRVNDTVDWDNLLSDLSAGLTKESEGEKTVVSDNGTGSLFD